MKNQNLDLDKIITSVILAKLASKLEQTLFTCSEVFIGKMDSHLVKAAKTSLGTAFS